MVYQGTSIVLWMLIIYSLQGSRWTAAGMIPRHVVVSAYFNFFPIRMGTIPPWRDMDNCFQALLYAINAAYYKLCQLIKILILLLILAMYQNPQHQNYSSIVLA